MTVCKSCGRPVEWAKTVKGTAMPLDVEATPDGNLVLVAGVARIRRPDDGDACEPRRSHFASCPQAGKWRRPR